VCVYIYDAAVPSGWPKLYNRHVYHRRTIVERRRFFVFRFVSPGPVAVGRVRISPGNGRTEFAEVNYETLIACKRTF